ncbi:GntR family transcriptional regulator [Hoeflea sp. G2-23]|uniref:GntR family transcriptional regulator n=1 Tax=Hoeflea algicola TaxID=2983763 RepID=A0ABT3ZF10_9HYPH|nr:GntR family transcriptional regulator [Hoeflea algicola]MCY0150382.1 GntR family transcriptional regulator [Hoeflea algicola]
MSTAKAPRPKRNFSSLAPLTTKTLVDQVVDAIVEATAKGIFLPGDRIVEAEVARSLNVSRIPVREALRLLESQGVVVSERYRGMRLMSVNIDRLEKTLKVRLALEKLAGAEVIARAMADPAILAPLEDIVTQMHAAADAGDGFLVASLDTAFHLCLCELSDNDTLVRTWKPLSRQLTIIFGLSTLKKDIKAIVAEHDDVIDALRKGDRSAFDKLMEVHILEYSRAVDYEKLVEQLRMLEHRDNTD